MRILVAGRLAGWPRVKIDSRYFQRPASTSPQAKDVLLRSISQQLQRLPSEC